MKESKYSIKFYRNKETDVIYKGILIDINAKHVNGHNVYNAVSTLLKDTNIKDYAVLPSNVNDNIYEIKINKSTLYTWFGVNIFLTDGDNFIIESRERIKDAYVEMTEDEVKRWDKIIFIKQCRKEIDSLIQEVRLIGNSNPVEYSLKALTEGCMWLGMELKRLNEPDPYPSSKDPSTGDTIEQTADNLKL